MDTVIDKPARIRGYPLHRMVEQLQQGVPALWVDEGSQLRIRPKKAEAPVYETGKLLGFNVTACVSFKCHGRHRYLPLDDWRGRKAWLEKQADKHGFQVVGVHVEPKMQTVEPHDGRKFRLDASGQHRDPDSKERVLATGAEWLPDRSGNRAANAECD